MTQAASFAAEQLSSQSNSLSPFEVKEVLSARSKVAAGKVFELKLKLSQGDLPEQIVQASACQSKERQGELLLFEKLYVDPSFLSSFLHTLTHRVMCSWGSTRAKR